MTLLIRDALHGQMADAAPLAQLVQEKTSGNPFFVNQFLKTLEQESYLAFDYEQGRWTYRIEAIAHAPLTDNVIDLMTRKIERLAARTQRALTLAACIGNPFDQLTLAIVSEQSPAATADDLREAVNEGLILPAVHHFEASKRGDPEVDQPAYAFLHDRVQQAAYAKIPDARKPHVHLTVGRLLLQEWESERSEEDIFDIASHMNLGSALIESKAEQLSLARLNLAAGRKAKSSTAYRSALGYLNTGIGILAEGDWRTEYTLAFALHLEAAECEYLCGQLEAAEAHFDFMIWRAQTTLDQGEVYKLKIIQYESMSRYLDAIQTGHRALALFGLTFPQSQKAMQDALETGLADIQKSLGQRAISSLLELPLMRDAETRMVMTLLASLHTSCYLSANKCLTLLNTTAMVRLSLLRGNSEESAYGYVLHAMHIGPIRGDFADAYEFGMLAIRLSDRFNNSAFKARVRMNFAWNVNIWRMPMSTSLPICRETFALANDAGLFVEATYASFNECYLDLLCGDHIAAVQKHWAPRFDYMKRVGMQYFAVGGPQVIVQWGLALQGLTASPASLNDANFSEEAFRRDYGGQGLFEMFFFVARLALSYTFDQYRAACEIAREAERVLQDYTGTIWDELTVFYHALALAASYDELDSHEREQADIKLGTARSRLAIWAGNAPLNFHHQHLLVCAEIERVRGNDGAAIALYEQAIAAPAECPRETALANELYAKFWLARGNDKIAAVYLRDARDRYSAWGAQAKVQSLTEHYGSLLSGRSEAATETGEHLDISTFVKAAHAISEKIVQEDFIEQMLEIAIENAGAQRGVLIERRDGELYIAAATGTPSGAAARAKPAAEPPLCASLGVIHYVLRAEATVVIGDAARDERFAGDAYIASLRPKSIFCTPILHQGKASAILYLENNLTTGAFTAERIEVMKVLSAQAAISLENARLFDGLKREIDERKRAEQKIREQAMLLDNARDAILVRDLEDRIVYWNKGAEQLYGWAAEEVLGGNAQDILLNDMTQLAAPSTGVREAGDWNGELRQRTKAGTEVVVQSRWTLVHAADGAPKSILVINTDITAKKKWKNIFCARNAWKA